MNETVRVINCWTNQAGKEPTQLGQIPRSQVKYKGASSLGTSSDKMGKLRPREECDPHKVTQQSWPELASANSTSPTRTAMDLCTSPCPSRASDLVLTEARKKEA